MSAKGKTIGSEGRKIIHSVMNFFEKEAKASAPLIPFAQVQNRAAAATGVSVKTIQRIKKQALNMTEGFSTPGEHRKRPAQLIAALDDFDLCALRHIVHEFYSNNKFPSLQRLLPVVKERLNFPWKKETLRKFLHQAGFRYKRCQKHRKIIIERPDIVAWRFRYLREIREHRKCGRKIIYLDETWIDSNVSFDKCWQNDQIGTFVKERAGNRLIIVHAGSEYGFVPHAQLVFKAGCATGDFHGQMNFENFQKWLNDKLIPNIPPNCVICLDNASYHTKVLDPVPTKYSTKGKMCEWLEQKNIAHDRNMRKAELFEIIAANAPKDKKFHVDELLRQHGHCVLRLPPYHCDLNPIELVWASVKRFVKERNVTAELGIERLKVLTGEALESISSEEWMKCCKHVEKLERQYWEADGLIEERVESVSFTVSIDSETESENGISSDLVESDTDSDCQETIDYNIL